MTLPGADVLRTGLGEAHGLPPNQLWARRGVLDWITPPRGTFGRHPRKALAVGRPVPGNRNDCKAWKPSDAKDAVDKATVIAHGGYRASSLAPARKARPHSTQRLPNNDKDTATLRKPTGTKVDSCSYNNSGRRYVYC